MPRQQSTLGSSRAFAGQPDVPKKSGSFMDELLGQVVDGYEIKELITTDSLGINEVRLYKGYDQALSRTVLIKFVSTEAENWAAGDETLNELRRRAQALAALRHSNISFLFRFGITTGRAYSIREYVARGSLQEQLEPGVQFSWQWALNIVVPVARALQFAHDRDIVHRNIKPIKILLPADDWPLVTFDVGLTSMLWQRPETQGIPLHALPMQRFETLNYASPEQIQGTDVDVRTDVYSLGVVLFELLCGQLPFKGATSFDLQMARLTTPPIPLLEANPSASPLLAPILDKALAQKPDDRYQTIRELSAALINAREQLSRRNGVGQPDTHGHLSSTPAEAAPWPQQADLVLRLTESRRIIFSGSQTELIVGRASKKGQDPKPTIDLTPLGGQHAGVSRRHARLARQDDQWLVEDFGSVNGTFVNGTRLPPYILTPVNRGDVLCFGQIELECGLED